MQHEESELLDTGGHDDAAKQRITGKLRNLRTSNLQIDDDVRDRGCMLERAAACGCFVRVMRGPETQWEGKT